MGRFFHNTYQLISRYRLWSFFVLIIILVGLAAVITNIEFEEDISKLIPINSENKDFEKVLKTVNFTDKIIVNIRRQSQGTVEELTQYASQFLDSLQASSGEYVKNIQGQVADADIGTTMDFVYNNLPIFLDEGDYVNISDKLSKDSLAAITKENYRTLISPSGIIAKKTILKDPLGISIIALKKLQQLGMGDGFKIKNGFLISNDEQHVLLFITPEYASNETAKNEKFVDTLYDIQGKLNSAFETKIQSEYFGAVLVAVANARQIKNDIQFTVGIALTLLLIVLIFFYKKLIIPIILFLPTVFGALLSIAFLYFLRTKISAISLGIGSVLLGVTLDYALHILTHIRNGNSIKNLYKDVAPSILMSSLTTAAAFLCLLFLKSQALQDLGIFAAVSVMGASIFALLFIPQVYKISSENKPGTTILDRLAAFNFHKSKWGISLVLLLVAMSFFTYNKVIFNNDIAKLNYEPQHLKEARMRLDALTDINSKSVYLATYGSDLEEVLQQNDTQHQMLLRLKKEGEILAFSSIGALVQSKESQTIKIKRWKQFWSTETVDSLQKNLIESGSTLGFKTNTFDKFYSILNSDFETLGLSDYNAIGALTIDDYLVTKDNFTTVTTLVKVDSTNTKLLQETFSGKPQTILIDRQGMNETFLGNLKNDFNRLIGYSILVVLLLLFLFFRNLSLTLVTSIPIFFTWFLTIGIMGLLGIEFNIFNIIISTFVFGLGVDYCIFMTNGLLTEYRTGKKALSTHKTSIILSVITTILGVGVLIFAKHPALYTISLVSLIGILSAAFVAFTMQPLLFRLFIGGPAKRPISLRVLLHSLVSNTYYTLGCIVFSFLSTVLMKIIPISKKIKMAWFHKAASKFLKSVLYSNPFVRKKIIDIHKANFVRPGIIISNHTSALDSLTIGMLHPKIIFLVNDWVYNSPLFKMAAQLAEFYPVSSGIENSLPHLQKKIDQGYSLMAFPEGTRSPNNKIKRFHKGAFYLSEQLKLDIIPILIHGNSEVQPKGSFVIRDGSITVRALDRIPLVDERFGETDRQRAKNISGFFKGEFSKFREEIENETYFHKIVLDDFRFKGNFLYKSVRDDLNLNKKTYHKILRAVGKKASILHCTEDNGQIDFLLSLDSVDRKIITVMPDEASRSIFANSFITNNGSKITVVENILQALERQIDTLIIDSKAIDMDPLFAKIQNEITILILLKTASNIPFDKLPVLDFETRYENDNFVLLQKKELK